MFKNIFTILLLFASSLVVGQAIQLPAELLKEQVSISYGDNHKYCLGMLGSGPIDYLDPFDNKWEITKVTNPEAKNYYAFRYKGKDSYLCYAKGFEDFNTRVFKEGVLLDRAAVFEVHKKGNYYALYCIGSKTFLHFKEFKRGGKVNGVSDIAKASSWDLIPVASDPQKFMDSYKAKEKSIAQHSFMICNEKEDKCISIDKAAKKTEWIAIPDHSPKVLWQIMPIPGFKGVYIIRNTGTGEYLKSDFKGGLRYQSGSTEEYASMWYVSVREDKVMLTPIPVVFGDNPKSLKVDESLRLSLIRRDN